MRATRKDVARLAGVSEQTVSYVLNGSRKLSDEIVERVQNATKELQYKPDVMARSISTKKTESVAILVNDISNPLFGEIFHGFQEQAAKSGYSVYLADAQNNLEMQIIDLISRKIDGIYMSLLSNTQMEKLIFQLNDCGIKVLVGNNLKNNQLDYSFIEIDMQNAMIKALDYLFEMGHTEIVYLSGIDPQNAYDMRYETFVNYYQRKLTKDPKVVFLEKIFETTVEMGYALTEKLLASKHKFTAVITTNDLMAYGAIDALQKNALLVGKDVSVIGFDDIMFSKYIAPALTTVGYDKKKYGKVVFKTLLGLIEGNSSNYNGTFPVDIIERNTVADLKNKNF